ncbi:MAG: metallophosphoesterase [Microscillaceae bacterium]|nr:metallophosphoesterase [Microscillaceae bacterium]
MKRYWSAFFLSLYVSACTSYKPYYKNDSSNWMNYKEDTLSEIKHTVFLIGDAGKPSLEKTEPTFKLLQKQLLEAGSKSTIAFLGDNIYPKGLPDSSDIKKRLEAEKYLIEQLKILDNYTGNVIFIPGNHDWAQGRHYGWQQLKNQEYFVENYLQKGNVFLPDQGCPGPIEIELNDDLVLIILDTQWWLHQGSKPGVEQDCDAKTDADFLALVDDAVKRHLDKKIIVAAHHPLQSNGTHGGHFPALEHLFPFAPKKYFIPLPVLGSMYVGYRKYFGSIQDIPNIRYRQLRNVLFKIFKSHPNLIYAAGHEHNLQYHAIDNWHQIISGAGSKDSWIAPKPKAEFAYAHKGFARLDFYENGETRLKFYAPDQDGETEEPIFQKKLIEKSNSLQIQKPTLPIPDYKDSTLQTAINTDYIKAKSLKRWSFGDNYRQEWAEVVKFPYFDLGSAQGGLEVLKRGGGQATNSLRLQASDGKQYVLRSVDKQADKALGEEFRGTVVAEIVQDQTSAAHPYAPLVIPKLAEVAGIHHSNPRYFYLPQDPRLGRYQYNFGGKVYLFEERADDEQWKNYEDFGSPQDIKSTAKVIEKLTEDNDQDIDQQSVVLHRLFDIWLGDWDRHDDQWRWAEYKNKEENYTYYRPIPRDRDQAFFLSDGFLVRFGSHKWGIPKFQGFHHKIRDVEGLNFNARYFDRYFINEASLEDWLAAAQTLQQKLNDQVIEEAMQAIPSEASHHNAEIISKLKQRRNDLETYARQYYLFLSENVNVLGSDKHERFEVKRLDDERVSVQVFKVKKEGREKKREIYSRIFKKSETNEIRLYGLHGEDEFIIQGKVNKSIKIRIIAGSGEDKIIDSSQVYRGGKKTFVYDKPDEVNLIASSETKNLISDKPDVNKYNRQEFRYNFLGPQIFLGLNPDDGPFIGGGIKIINHGFRKEPYKMRHTIKGNVALATGSYNFIYKGEFKELLGGLDLVIDADVRAPNYVQNFFGLGNESKSLLRSDIEDIRYYRVRFEQWLLNPQIRKQWNNETHSLSLGVFGQQVSIERNEDRFISNFEANGLDSLNLFDTRRYFAGGSFQYFFDKRNNPLIPTRGMTFRLESQYFKGLNDVVDRVNYLQLKSDLAFYLNLSSSATLAMRVGGTHNFGDFEFFQANGLGAKDNLRGFRNYRFSGRSSFYQNLDLRLRLFRLRTFLFNGQLGLIGIHDFGRVWTDGEKSRRFHRGYGGGFWFTPAEATVIETTLTTAPREGSLFYIRIGFLF